MITQKNILFVLVIAFTLGLAGCKSYLLNRYAVYNLAYANQWKQAESKLAKLEKAGGRNNRVLYMMDRGLVNYELGDLKSSIAFLNEADLKAEDLNKRLSSELLALVTNPNVTPYYADNCELLLVHYYKALAYWQAGLQQDALIEVRRMDNRLKVMDAEKGWKARSYRTDAFAHTFMGIVYDASGDFNNAFIAYRNALKAYETDYQKKYKLVAPLQLKKDLIRTAYLSGLASEGRQFEKELNLKYEPLPSGSKEAVIFYHAGKAPIKTSWSLIFLKVRDEASNNYIVYNPELGLSFPIPISKNDSNWRGVSSLRIALPRYLPRGAAYTNAKVLANGKEQNFEEAEPVGDVKRGILRNEFLAVLGKELARVAIKKGEELALRKNGKDNVGASILSLANTLSEQPDLRTWELLPNDIQYARIAVADTASGITLKMQASTLQLDGWNRPRQQFVDREVRLPLNQKSRCSLLSYAATESFGDYVFPDDKTYWNSISQNQESVDSLSE